VLPRTATRNSWSSIQTFLALMQHPLLQISS